MVVSSLQEEGEQAEEDLSVRGHGVMTDAHRTVIADHPPPTKARMLVPHPRWFDLLVVPPCGWIL